MATQSNHDHPRPFYTPRQLAGYLALSERTSCSPSARPTPAWPPSSPSRGLAEARR